MDALARDAADQEGGVIEQIEWKPASAPPDADTTVIVKCPRLDEPVWFGWYDGEEWFLVDGAPLIAGDVAYWADLPGGPT